MDDVLPVRDTTLGSRRPSVPARARTGKFSPPRALLSTTGYIRSRPVDPAVAAGQRIAHPQGQVPPRGRLDDVTQTPPAPASLEGGGGGGRGGHQHPAPPVPTPYLLRRGRLAPSCAAPDP